MNKVKSGIDTKGFYGIYIAIEFIIIHIILLITDKIIEATEGNIYIIRLASVFLLTFLLSFLVIKLSEKHVYKKDAKSFKRALIILPIIVSVILFLWGLYAVHTNLQTYKEENFFYRFYSSNSKYESIIELLDSRLEEERKEAIVIWLLTSVCYLIPSEIISLIMRATADNYFLEDLPTNESPQPLNLAEEINMNSGAINISQNDINQSDTSQGINNIKWDL